MGNCVGKSPVDCPNRTLDRFSQAVSKGEIYILHLIYLDLAERIEDSKINLENFLLFFHKNGYWGERLFQEFDYDETNLLSEPEFIHGISKIFKSSEKEKINLLFKFFAQGHDKNGGIAFHDFLTMLYNYPKEDLNQILNDKEFIEQELQAHLVPIGEKKCEAGMGYYSLQSSNHIRQYLPSSSTDLVTRLNRKFSTKSKNSDKIDEDQFPSMLGRQVAKSIQKKQKASESLIRLKYQDKVLNIRAINIQQLVKMFAQRIFKEANIDIKTGRLNFQQFYNWISKHQALYKNYYNGFHNEIWEIDRATTKPKYLIDQCQKCSEAKALINNQLIHVKLFLHHHILVACNSQTVEKPLLVICLEGLAVRRIFEIQNGFGIQISHRDGVYQDKKFFFKNQELLIEWINLLSFYKGYTVQNRYDIGEKIGHGKFSVVYKCTSYEDNHQYALKEIALYKLDNEARTLIAHQSSIMQVLSHPFLLEFKECIQTKTHMYIITELVKGVDLFEHVKKKCFLREKEAAKICQQIIVGVRFLHSLQIVHRDLKPQNIMVVVDENTKEVENIKIIDFGFSNYLSKLNAARGQYDMAGTPNYIAPQVLKQQPFDFKIDNFAIGVILYFMLMGCLPFYDMGISQTLINTMNGTYTFSDHVVVSSEAKSLVDQLLKNDPKERISLERALEHQWFRILNQGQ